MTTTGMSRLGAGHVDVRLAGTADAVQLSDIYRPYVEGTVTSFEIEAPGPDELAARVAATVPDHPWLVAVAGKAVLGYAYAHPFAARAAYRWSAETSIYLRSGETGRGIGRRLYSTLLAILAAQGYREAFAGVTLPNPASAALHESMGFARAATFERAGWKFGSWHDVGWWQRSLVDSGGEPSEPVPVDALDDRVIEGLFAGGTTP